MQRIFNLIKVVVALNHSVPVTISHINVILDSMKGAAHQKIIFMRTAK